ncbi:DNA primase [Streptomyces sp. BG9H]|uniref:DNA primase n=1 Tax=Streptomyces anatolicus TaxID=2675858 RepID=A0ABS6YKN8_9ACTN|nr:DNA primase [Streptomyces anatolicus]MBW5421629.1 DNA primase [Streptomyces anatolicus]
MNRLAMGLAVGAGYVLGRTKKAKFAFAVGTMVAGKKLNLSPKALGSLVTQQLENNPQFKEIGDQLREDLRGVGKAATGSLLNRQLEGLADRLHDRTLDVQDRISGVVPDEVKGSDRDDEDAEDGEDAEDTKAEDAEDSKNAEDEEEPAGRRKKTAAKRPSAQKPKSEPKAAAKKTAVKKTTARKTAQKKSASAARGTARKTASATRTGSRAKGGDRG